MGESRSKQAPACSSVVPSRPRMRVVVSLSVNSSLPSEPTLYWIGSSRSIAPWSVSCASRSDVTDRPKCCSPITGNCTTLAYFVPSLRSEAATVSRSDRLDAQGAVSRRTEESPPSMPLASYKSVEGGAALRDQA